MSPPPSTPHKRKFAACQEEKENILPQHQPFHQTPLQFKLLNEPLKFHTEFTCQPDFFEFNNIVQMEEPSLLGAFPSHLEEVCNSIILPEQDECEEDEATGETDLDINPNSFSQNPIDTSSEFQIPKKGSKRKIKIEFLDERSKRLVTFSKRKNGLMKKAHELNTLTGSEVLLLITSEKGCVYTYASAKFQPMINQVEGRTLIQECLGANELFPIQPNGNPRLVSACNALLPQGKTQLWPVTNSTKNIGTKQ